VGVGARVDGREVVGVAAGEIVAVIGCGGDEHAPVRESNRITELACNASRQTKPRRPAVSRETTGAPVG
jgi:hypothetical protein